MTILVIDGQGGKLGKTLVENIKKSFPHLEIMAVGTNSAASDVMRRAGADRVATGENPVIVACRSAQIIVGNRDAVEVLELLLEQAALLVPAFTLVGAIATLRQVQNVRALKLVE